VNPPPPETLASTSVFAPRIAELPSGNTGLPRELVNASQRQRLLNAVTATAASKGYGPATVADITTHAGVSKKTFYEHFSDKLDCFLAAYDYGRDALMAEVTRASRAAVDAGAGPIGQLRHATRAYLAFLVAEESYSRTFFLEIFAAGPEALERHRLCRGDFIASLRLWHESARRACPDWAAASAVAYEAATGAAHELALGRIAAGATAELLDLEDDLLDVQLAILRVPRTAGR
jgi:AcrR family transcriptional regulator